MGREVRENRAFLLRLPSPSEPARNHTMPKILHGSVEHARAARKLLHPNTGTVMKEQDGWFLM